MTREQPNNPLHGVTLETMLREMVDRFGWEGLARDIPIRCFRVDPSLTSALKYLRKAPRARQQVEDLYRLFLSRQQRRSERRPKPEAVPVSASSRRSRRIAAFVLGLSVLTLLTAFTSLDAATPAARPGRTVAGLLATAHAQRWDTLAIGERVARFGRALAGTPYVEGTLEGPGPEQCRVTVDGFDCVTFMETALDLARTLEAADGRAPGRAALTRAITFTRYRGGRIDGYASRLHYTSEWIADNVAKGVLEDVTPSLGGVPFPLHVDFMSTHPERYAALRRDPALVDSLRWIERRTDSIRRTYVPRDRVAAIEQRLRTGDLVAFTTSVRGLDYGHTGLIVRDGRGARLLHASSEKGRVVLDDRIGAWLARAPRSFTGISVLRPMPVAAR